MTLLPVLPVTKQILHWINHIWGGIRLCTLWYLRPDYRRKGDTSWSFTWTWRIGYQIVAYKDYRCLYIRYYLCPHYRYWRRLADTRIASEKEKRYATSR